MLGSNADLQWQCIGEWSLPGSLELVVEDLAAARIRHLLVPVEPPCIVSFNPKPSQF